jgi:hypothetical protein
MASIASATAARDAGRFGISSGSGTGSTNGALFLALGGCELARLSTGIPIKFRGDVKTDSAAGRENVDVGFGGMGGCPPDEEDGRGGRGFHARWLLKVFSCCSLGGEVSSSELVAILIGDRGAGGVGRGSRGGGHAYEGSVSQMFQIVIVLQKQEYFTNDPDVKSTLKAP